ncbi:DUF7507 domain-containing protein [Nonlabens agnitus]|uniref:DUF7507 domain-containing protein n=1 Tax=Nonlabens agnitus TaxID=870484 RepID=A0A2S9WYA5_9FLAO|nr:hypothetical protein [Nonlabens agnitus]PRP68444.1 hypothetical protein BST86_00100 [Nonlabens agnitus]
MTNSGATTLTNVTVTDPLLGWCQRSLTGVHRYTGTRSNGTTTFSGSYTIQQSDIDGASVSNQANGYGNDT